MAFPTPAAPEQRRVYTVGELNRLIQAALQDAFPGTVWVRGEVQRLPRDAAARKHVYFELHDAGAGEAAGYQIPVALMEWDRRQHGLSCYLDGSDPDLQLQEKMEVCLECRVDFYPPYGKLSLKCVGLDPSFTLGRLEARRREVLAFLKREGLLERQAGLELPLLPLRVGLITAAGSAAHEDFTSGLAASPYPFTVHLVACPMSGTEMEGRIAAALDRLCARGVDAIVICRGGGSRGDLSWFDQKGIALAIAHACVPVITAIGHEIDRSIADAVAHRSVKTPTAAAELLVDRVERAAGRLQDAAAGVARAARQALDLTGSRLEGRRARLQAASGRRLAAARAGWEARRDRAARAAPLCAAAAGRRLGQAERRLAAPRLLGPLPQRARALDNLRGRLGRLATSRLEAAAVRLDSLGQRTRLLDPGQQLERGYTLTLDRQGRLLRSVGEVAAGMVLETRFRDGSVRSVAGAAGPDGGPAAPRRRRAAARGGKGEPAQEDPAGEPGQGTLFR